MGAGECVLVTGGLGFTGARPARPLLGRGREGRRRGEGG